jgi:hypothetical protein
MTVGPVQSTRPREQPEPTVQHHIRRTDEDSHVFGHDVDVAAFAKRVSLDDDRFKVDLGDTAAFVHGARIGDVRQGFIGDCTVMSSLAALARTPKGQVFLESRITENYGADGKVASYTVLLTVGGKERAVTVNAHRLEAGHWLGDKSDSGAHEVWPLVYQDAIAQVVGGYDKLDEGSNVPMSFGMITGKPAIDSSPTDADFGDKLQKDFAAGKVQILSTDDDPKKAPPGGWCTGNPKLMDGHAYTVTDVRQVVMRGADDRYHLETIVTVRNPWGRDDPRPLTLSEAQKYFNAYSVGDVP